MKDKPNSSSSEQSDSTGYVMFLQFVFLISGISQTCLVNLVSYNGGASPSTLLPVFVSYSGMAVVYFLPQKQLICQQTNKHSKSAELKIMFLAFYDIGATIVLFLSLVWSGSALFQLVYSSIIIVTATFRHFLLPNKKLSFHQWIACFIVTFGLLLSGFGNNKHYTKGGGSISIIENMIAAFSQLLWPLIATILYAIEYVLIEMLLHSKTAKISDNELCYKMGFYGLIFVCLYILFNVIPQWNTVFIHEITIHNGSGLLIIISYFWIFISNFLHNYTYFKLLHNSGAVSTGINQAVRAVGVFVISGMFFCELQESQCFNSFKFLSLIIVIFGVLRYAFITAMSKNRYKYLVMKMDENKHLV